MLQFQRSLHFIECCMYSLACQWLVCEETNMSSGDTNPTDLVEGTYWFITATSCLDGFLFKKPFFFWCLKVYIQLSLSLFHLIFFDTTNLIWSVKVFRCQLPRTNQFYSSNPPKHDGTDRPLGSGGNFYVYSCYSYILTSCIVLLEEQQTMLQRREINNLS